MGRPGSDINLALRVDVKRSTLPALEYYCEYNGERDYLNYLYSTAIGSNRATTTVAGGTTWTLYGDLRPWQGADPQILYGLPMLSTVAP